MPTGFHPSIYAAFPGDRAIVLDVAADRYRRLDRMMSDALRLMLAGGEADSHALAALLRSRILATDAPMRPLALAMITQPIFDSNGLDVAPLALNRCAAALAKARFGLGRHGLAQSLAGVRRRAAHALTDDPAAASEVARRFAHARRWLPFARRCLPDGIALHALLSAHGLAARLVIGVRDQPFAAHCWVQAGDRVMSDSLGTVVELTPILVV